MFASLGVVLLRIGECFERLMRLLAFAAGLLLLVMIVLVTADIILRNTINIGVVWVNEVCEYALYLMTLLTAPWLLHRGRHVRLDLFLTAIPRRAAWLSEGVADVIGLCVCLVILRASILLTFDAWQSQFVTIKNFVFPEWWLLAPLPFTFVLLATEFLLRFGRLMQRRSPREEATSVA